MRLTLRTRTVAACALTLAVLVPGAPAQAQGQAQTQARRDAGEVRGLKLGLKAPSMTLDGFGELACGSNGGPPRQKIDGWLEFAKCRPEESGLHEVYARFEDEDEYIGKAIDDPRYAKGKLGT